MFLFHGSGTIVAEPIIVPSQKLSDFGPGFYTTDDEIKAWQRAQAVIKQRDAFLGSNLCYVSEYEINLRDKDLKIKIFDTPNIEWLDQIISCHKTIPIQGYDIVIGPVADARAKKIIKSYCSELKYLQDLGESESSNAVKELKERTISSFIPFKPYSQYVMISPKSFEKLEYKKAYIFSDKGPLLHVVCKGCSFDVQKLQKISKTIRKSEKWKGLTR